MYRIVQIKDLKEYDAIKGTWIDGYKDDPSMIFFKTYASEREALTAKLCIRAGIVGGQFYAAYDQKNRVVGTALWYPPGKDALADEKQLDAVSEVLEEMQASNDKSHDWFMSILMGIVQKPPKDYKRADNWKLYSFTVAKEHERTGLDKLLLKTGEDQAAARGLATCYEEMRDDEIERFKRLGYHVVAKASVPGPPHGHGFELSYLIKHPTCNEGDPTN